MKKNILILKLFLTASSIGIICRCPLLFALTDLEERYPTVEVSKPAVPQKVVQKATGKPAIKTSASLIFGYDNNIRLDHYDGTGSLFFQEAAGINGKYPLNNTFTFRGSYNLTAINYLRASDPNLVDNLFDAGMDIKMGDDFVWSLDYRPDIVDLPHDELGKYTEQRFETSLRQNISGRIYQKIIYALSTRHYPKWAIRNNGGVFRFGNRNDIRNTVTHQIGFYLTDKIFLKEDNTFYYNHSNEQYLRYYDYKNYLTTTTLIHFTTKKLYETADFTYQYTSYDKRSVSDIQEKEREHLFILGGSVFYDITSYFTVGTTFNYRKNLSNEGVHNYNDYIISGGAYCRF